MVDTEKKEPWVAEFEDDAVELPPMFAVGMFAECNADHFGEWGVEKGDTVYLAGEGMAPMDEKDPYTCRRLFTAAYVVDGHVQADKQLFIVDPKHLDFIDEERQEELVHLLADDFSPEAEADEEEDGDEVSH